MVAKAYSIRHELFSKGLLHKPLYGFSCPIDQAFEGRFSEASSNRGRKASKL